MGPTYSTETSANSYKHTLRKNAAERRSFLHRGIKLESSTYISLYFAIYFTVYIGLENPHSATCFGTA